MKKPTPHAHIIARFGGIRPMARALDHPNATTVSYWAAKGIPRWRHHEVLAASRKKRLGIRPEDFAK